MRFARSASKPTVHAQGRPSAVAERTPKQAATLESAPPPAPSVDRLFARLALAATATERCALLERLQPSEDPQATYVITAVLERAWFGSVRACATQALGRQPTIEAQSWLLDLAEDPEPEVHRSALEALATRDDAARAAVVNATEGEDLELRVSAALALLKAKRVEGYAAAVRVLPSVEDAEALSTLIDALGQSHDPRALPALEDLLDNAERENHLRAISALGELGVPSAAARLKGLLEVGSGEEFSAAAQALNKLSTELLVAQLRAVLGSENSDRQELALASLPSFELPVLSSLETELVALAEHGNQNLQPAAMRALSALPTPSARSALQRMANSLPPLVAQALLDQGSGNLERAREQRLSDMKRGDDVPSKTLYELARDPSEDAQSLLLGYLDRHELEPQVLARLVKVAPSSTVERLIARNAGSPASASEGLIEGLSRRGDPRFNDALRANLRGDQPTRNAALAALVKLGDDSVLPDLRQLAKNGDASDRELAVQLLDTRSDADASRELERLASDPEAQVMSSALHALQSRSPELVTNLAQRALREAAPENRANVLSLLSDLQASASRPLFELALADAEDSVVVQAVQSLANLQGAGSARRLLLVVNDASRSEEVRREAASGLRTLGGPLARANRALLDSLSEPEAGGAFVCSPN